MESEVAFQMTRKPRDFAPRASRGSCGRCTSWGCNPLASGCRVGSDTHLYKYTFYITNDNTVIGSITPNTHIDVCFGIQLFQLSH